MSNSKQKFYGKMEDGLLRIKNMEEFTAFLSQFEGKDIQIEVKKCTNQRTLRQNRAIHKYFGLLAKTLNDGGLDMRKVMKQDVAIPWTPETVKDNLWRPVQEAFCKKKSTTKLTTKEIGQIYEVLNAHLGQVFSVHVPFPSNDVQMLRDMVEKS